MLFHAVSFPPVRGHSHHRIKSRHVQLAASGGVNKDLLPSLGNLEWDLRTEVVGSKNRPIRDY